MSIDSKERLCNNLEYHKSTTTKTLLEIIFIVIFTFFAMARYIRKKRVEKTKNIAWLTMDSFVSSLHTKRTPIQLADNLPPVERPSIRSILATHIRDIRAATLLMLGRII